MQEATTQISVNPADLPSPPAAIARVVRLASDPEVTSEKLGAVIASDPAFTAELLRTVNSPFYGLKQPVTAASRAVTVLGIRALRNLAICFAVRDSLRNSGFRAQDLEVFWEDCLRRAVAARVLARTVGGVAPEEAFTVGLLQDFGMLALLKANRRDFTHWNRWRALGPDERRLEERERYAVPHDELARQLGDRWGLPRQLVDALAGHHEPQAIATPGPTRELGQLAQCADHICSLLAARTSSSLTSVRGMLKRAYKFDDAATDAVLEALPTEVEAAASALGMRVGKQPRFADVLAEANRTLVEMNVSYEELTQRLERLLMEKEMLMEQLALANAELARLAFFDALTGLCNRRHFESLFRDLLTRAATESRPVSLVMVDLDRFKLVNDTYGHATGDAVLRATSAALVSASHDADIKARLGGEELAVVLPDTDAHQALAAAERFREAIARAGVSTHQGPLRVTASFGVATFMGSGARVDLDRLASVLSEVADKALYESKNNGRNRVTIGGVVR